MSSSKSFNKRLDRWMLEQFNRQGYTTSSFIGKEKFIKLLISEYEKTVGGVVPKHELRDKVRNGAWPPQMQKPKGRPSHAFASPENVPIGTNDGNQDSVDPVSPIAHAVTTTRSMSANANENMPTDWDSASYHGVAEANEQPYRAQFSHGLPTPTDDRDRDPVYEDDLYNLDPPDSESTGRVRERVTNEWVASAGNQPIDPSNISSPEIPSTRLPSTEVPSPEEALPIDQVEAIETESNGHSVSSHRRILPLRSRRVADQACIPVEPRPRHVEPPVNEHRPIASKPVEAEAHLNPRLEELRQFTQKPRASAGPQTKSPRKSKADEDDLLRWSSSEEEDNDLIGGEESAKDEIQNAALFSQEILKSYDPDFQPQHALLGVNVIGKQTGSKRNVKLYQNTNVPNSVFICGLQGSGKSHTLSCLIENCLIQAPMLGQLHTPLSALIFHFSQYTSRISFRPCEAAYLGCPNQSFPDHPCVAPVNVLVAPSNYHNLRQSYGQIPGVRVYPFKLRPRDLNVSSMLTLMSVEQGKSSQPLYISTITKVLRDMASASSGDFDYRQFKKLLYKANLTKLALAPLEQRLELLESFLNMDESASSWDFKSGGATIIDLSCPFVDPNMACVLFNIGMSLYLESGLTTGKVIAMDEAHKYLTNTTASRALTESLLQVIRQQRHYGVRVIISTQEPTISPRLMDLCSSTVIHRFTSPEWFLVLRKHISMEDGGNPELFKRILDLRVGEGLLFAPSTLLVSSGDADGWGGASVGVPMRLGAELLKIKVRRRVTWDGGKSILASEGGVGRK